MDFTCEGPIDAIIGSTDKTTLKALITATKISQRRINIESKDYYNIYQHTALRTNEIDCIHQVAVLKGKSHLNMYDTVRFLCHYYKKD